MTQQLCWSCKNVYGGCSWTAIDPASDTCLFQPVEGWTAQEVGRRGETGFLILKCPLYQPDEPKEEKLP